MNELAWLREMERTVRKVEGIPDAVERGFFGAMPKGSPDLSTTQRHAFLADWYEVRGDFYRRARRPSLVR